MSKTRFTCRQVFWKTGLKWPPGSETLTYKNKTNKKIIETNQLWNNIKHIFFFSFQIFVRIFASILLRKKLLTMMFGLKQIMIWTDIQKVIFFYKVQGMMISI